MEKTTEELTIENENLKQGNIKVWEQLEKSTEILSHHKEREIKMENSRFKFRVWYTPIYSCEDDEKPHYVYDVEQIYDGYINKGPSELGWVSSFGSLLDNGEYIVEQCTGLKDKNGKLIYEGDWLKTKDGYYCYVVWFNGFWWVKSLPSAMDLEHAEFYRECEVVGNIHTENINDM